VLILPADVLKEAITQVVIAASLDENRPVLAGVYMHTEDNNLVLVATDSYRLTEKKIPLKTKTELSVIIPARTMQELVRILGDATGDVNIYLEENQVMFQVDSVELTSRLIEGQFPNYKQIIPEDVETTAVVDTDELTRITKVASLFARENAGSMRIEIQAEGQIRVISSASQVGENNSNAECEVSGDDGEVSLNSRYLSDALSVVKDKQTRFSISGKLNPCIIQPDTDEEAENYIHIIMPLRT
jgi:DNA polymerase III subunit beta